MTQTDHSPSQDHGSVEAFAELRQGFSETLARACALYAVATPGQAVIFLQDLDAWPAARQSLGITAHEVAEAQALVQASVAPLKAAPASAHPCALGLVDPGNARVPVPDLVSALPDSCALCCEEKEDRDA
jgi:hypothetical protein